MWADEVQEGPHLGNGREVEEGPRERVEEADDVGGLIAEDKEALGGVELVVGGERWEVNSGAHRGGKVEKDTAQRRGAVGEHHPVAEAEAAVEVAAPACSRFRGALVPGLAHGPEDDVVRHVGGEQPAGDVLSELGRQAGPVPPARGSKAKPT